MPAPLAAAAPAPPPVEAPAGTDAERLEEVVKIKEQANGKFRERDYFSAKCLYAGGLEMLERCCLHMDRADETWEGLKNNMALCDLKRQEWTRVVDATTDILTRNSANTKALYRRGVARVGQGRLADAQRDLRALLDIEPDNADARSRLAEVVQQLRQKRSADRDQADKMRGFLRGERLDDTVPVSKDGGVRKLHGNENAPLYSSWIKREWVSPNNGLAAAVTCHVVLKTQAGKELWSSRKPPGAFAPQEAGPHVVNQALPAERPIEPVRWVLDDSWGGVFQAWNAAVKSLQLHELGRFEVAKHTLGPSVEPAVNCCLRRWLSDTPGRRDRFKDVPQDVQDAAKRRQALQILCLPEELCAEPVSDPNATLSMELELLEVGEFLDLDGDGRRLLRVLKEGKRRMEDVPCVTDLSTVAAHFRIAKLLMNLSLKDTRMGLASGPDGLVMRPDKTKEPLEFVMGEENAAREGEYVPPCIGQSILAPPGGVVEGMHFELILRDGVPISEMEESISNAYADGSMDLEVLPDTSGPVVIKIEVEKVVPATAGPSSLGWKGQESLATERRRSEELEAMARDGRHHPKALKRWRRILVWLEALLEARRWRVASSSADGAAAGAASGSMYDLEWPDDEGATAATGSAQDHGHTPSAGSAASAAGPDGPGAGVSVAKQTSSRGVPELPRLFEVDDDLLRQLSDAELREWATAHGAIARLLTAARPSSDPASAKRHARLAVRASEVGQVPKEVEVAARSTLAASLVAEGDAQEALEVLKAAQTLDPTNVAIRDQAALATQKATDGRFSGMKDTLWSMKRQLGAALESNDPQALLRLLQEVEALPLTWEAVSETALGKEVGRCVRHEDAAVAERAKAIVGALHRLAKQQRPMWVR